MSRYARTRGGSAVEVPATRRTTRYGARVSTQAPIVTAMEIEESDIGAGRTAAAAEEGDLIPLPFSVISEPPPAAISSSRAESMRRYSRTNVGTAEPATDRERLRALMREAAEKRRLGPARRRSGEAQRATSAMRADTDGGKRSRPEPEEAEEEMISVATLQAPTLRAPFFESGAAVPDESRLQEVLRYVHSTSDPRYLTDFIQSLMTALAERGRNQPSDSNANYLLEAIRSTLLPAAALLDFEMEIESSAPQSDRARYVRNLHERVVQELRIVHGFPSEAGVERRGERRAAAASAAAYAASSASAAARRSSASVVEYNLTPLGRVVRLVQREPGGSVEPTLASAENTNDSNAAADYVQTLAAAIVYALDDYTSLRPLDEARNEYLDETFANVAENRGPSRLIRQQPLQPLQQQQQPPPLRESRPTRSRCKHLSEAECRNSAPACRYVPGKKLCVDGSSAQYSHSALPSTNLRRAAQFASQFATQLPLEPSETPMAPSVQETELPRFSEETNIILERLGKEQISRRRSMIGRLWARIGQLLRSQILARVASFAAYPRRLFSLMPLAGVIMSSYIAYPYVHGYLEISMEDSQAGKEEANVAYYKLLLSIVESMRWGLDAATGTFATGFLFNEGLIFSRRFRGESVAPPAVTETQTSPGSREEAVAAAVALSEYEMPDWAIPGGSAKLTRIKEKRDENERKRKRL